MAMPNAHGQEMTSTAMVRISASACSRERNITTSVTAATTTTRHKDAETPRRARWARGCSSPPHRADLRDGAAAPSRVARTWRTPPAFRLPPMTAQPGDLSRGADSPVTTDSSTLAIPTSTTPSAGIRSPALTTKTLPGWSASMETKCSLPSAIRRAFFGIMR